MYKSLKKIIKIGLSFLGLAILLILILGKTQLGNLDKIGNYSMPFIEIGGEKIRFIQKGTGEDILFIHGSPGSIEDWIKLIDTLSHNYRVTAFDRFGHGLSTSNNYNYTLGDNATLTINLIKELNIESPLIIGHSYGGSVASYLAANNSVDDAEYIIIDSPLYEYDSKIMYSVISSDIFGEGISVFASLTFAKNQIHNSLEEIFENLDKTTSEDLINERKLIWSQPKVIYSKAKEAANYDKDLKKISNKYKNINSKITIITGTDSTKTFRNNCLRLHRDLKSSEFIELENTGHYIQIDKFNEIVKVINENFSLKINFCDFYFN
ncbi:alpha/beta fold hydrolase [Yeosuana marina]|uniref:alpha/beta fold hydrolase n=1 Tax=Yeosuana marina TaxID=1565536 RepID=UPI00141F7F88|nr:alpha/beta hydrolase [Yeosuana marina]